MEPVTLYLHPDQRVNTRLLLKRQLLLVLELFSQLELDANATLTVFPSPLPLIGPLKLLFNYSYFGCY